MSQRRMFSPDIVESEEFLTMPVSSQALYFHLGMNADDDGFIQPKMIMRLMGAQDDDLKVLLSKRFLLPFETGVVVIKHWLIHNMIRSDRYKETRFKDEKSKLTIKENKAYTEKNKLGCQNDNQMAPQVRLGKVSIDNSETSSPIDKNSLLEKIGMKPKSKASAYQWQDEASNAVKILKATKISSIFKCFKDNNQKARIALSDCKELGKLNEFYFLKIYNKIKN